LTEELFRSSTMQISRCTRGRAPQRKTAHHCAVSQN